MRENQKALYFPNVAGSNLNGEKTNTTELLTGKTTLLTILNTRLSEVSHSSDLTRLR